MKTSTIISFLATATFVTAQRDIYARLTKPALHPNLDYLKTGLQNSYPQTSYTKSQWAAGTIPADCRTIALNEKRNVADINVFDIKYSDCATPWQFCHHKNTEVNIDSMARQFGQLPVQMRQWVKHVISLPDTAKHAYYTGGNVVFFRPDNLMSTVIVHEVGHSLDLNKAYGIQISGNSGWWSAYDSDPKVPDPYAQSNTVENVAQNTVVSAFDSNVPGGFPGVESGYHDIIHQYQFVTSKSKAAGVNGIPINKPGGTCTRRFAPSARVKYDGTPARKRDIWGRSLEFRFAPGIQVMSDPSSQNKTECHFHHDD